MNENTNKNIRARGFLRLTRTFVTFVPIFDICTFCKPFYDQFLIFLERF